MKTKIELSSGIKVSTEILERLKKRTDLLATNIYIGCFTNCRECGFTYVAMDCFVDGEVKYIPTDYWFTFCTYEHRNSDSIIINGKKGLISLAGDLPYAGDKWDYLSSVGFEEYDKATDELVRLINEKVTEYISTL